MFNSRRIDKLEKEVEWAHNRINQMMQERNEEKMQKMYKNMQDMYIQIVEPLSRDASGRFQKRVK